MRRLAATLACDLRLQYRNGFLLAAALVALIWVLGLSQVPDAVLDRLLPAFLVSNLIVNTFYFTAGQVFLEKEEGTLAMRDATPLRPHEYLASKAATLALLSVAESLIIVLSVRGPAFQPVLFILGIAAAAALLVLAGFAAISRYPSVNEFLLPSTLWVAAFVPPFLPAFGLADGRWLRLHPLDPPLTLLRASFAGAGAGEIAYGLAASAAWALAGLLAGKGAFERLRRSPGASG